MYFIIFNCQKFNMQNIFLAKNDKWYYIWLNNVCFWRKTMFFNFNLVKFILILSNVLKDLNSIYF